MLVPPFYWWNCVSSTITIMVQTYAPNKKKREFYDYNGATMLAAPLTGPWCNVYPFLCVQFLAHFFTFTLKFVSPSSNCNEHRLQCRRMIWLLPHPLPLSLLYFNGAANKKIFSKAKCCQQKRIVRWRIRNFTRLLSLQFANLLRIGRRNGIIIIVKNKLMHLIFAEINPTGSKSRDTVPWSGQPPQPFTVLIA